METREQNITISIGTITKSIVIVLLFAALFILRDLVLVLLVSIVVASAVEPGTQWFIQRKVPRIFAVILIYLFIGVALASTVFFLLIPLLSESSDFLRNFPIYFNANIVSDTIGDTGFVAGLTNSLNIEEVIMHINSAIATISTNAFGTVTAFFGGLLSFFLMAILSFYLAVEEDGVGKFLKAITTIKHEAYVVDLWKRSQRKIGLWMQGQLVLAIIIGMLVYLGLLIINVPNALLLAALAAAFEIIPLFGPIIASIPAVMIAFVSGGFPMALVVIGLYLIVHQFENQLIYPLVVKKVVGVSPIVSIIALAAGWQLAGFVGLILSVPIAAVIIEFFDDFEKNKIESLERMNASTQ
ncbi:MAG: putative integral membrane protein [Parcubacteria bacterium C7867-006]|nr:MAG: putative integral membrane protein [Parcubacteria bacterium C7867-006]